MMIKITKKTLIIVSGSIFLMNFQANVLAKTFTGHAYQDQLPGPAAIRTIHDYVPANKRSGALVEANKQAKRGIVSQEHLQAVISEGEEQAKARTQGGSKPSTVLNGAIQFLKPE